jgi:hypothetical protein
MVVEYNLAQERVEDVLDLKHARQKAYTPCRSMFSTVRDASVTCLEYEQKLTPTIIIHKPFLRNCVRQ